MYSFPVLAWAKLFKRSILDDKIFPEGRAFEDTVAFIELLFRAKKIAFHDSKKNFYWYRQGRNGSMMQTLNTDTIYNTDTVAAGDCIVRSFQKHAPELMFYALEKNIYSVYDRMISLSPEVSTYFDTLEKSGAYILQNLQQIDERDLDKSVQNIDRETRFAPFSLRYLYEHARTLTPIQMALLCIRYEIFNPPPDKMGFAEIKAAFLSWIQRKSGVQLNAYPIYIVWIAVLWNLFRFAIRKKMRHS